MYRKRNRKSINKDRITKKDRKRNRKSINKDRKSKRSTKKKEKESEYQEIHDTLHHVHQM